MERLLSKREDKLMNIIWAHGEALTTDEMYRCSKEKVSKVTIFKTVQSLWEKGFIDVVGMEQSTNTYARKFSATITPVEYDAIISTERGLKPDEIGDFMVALFGKYKSLDEGEETWVKNEIKKILEYLSM